MALYQFITCLPQLGLEFGQAKAKEVRYLLAELKKVIAYPEYGVRAQIQRILEEYDPDSPTPQISQTRIIHQLTDLEFQFQNTKTVRIMAEIEKIMKFKKQLAE